MEVADQPNIQLVVLGAGAVGKSSLVVRQAAGTFVDDYDPTIEDKFDVDVTVSNVTYTCTVLDTAGQVDYSTIRDTHLRVAEGFIMVYSITDPESFRELPKLIQQVESMRGEKAPPMVVVGNKLDHESQRIVSTAEGQELADGIGNAGFFETSAKRRINITHLFVDIVKRVIVARERRASIAPRPSSSAKSRGVSCTDCVVL